jgi:hypothetical protein
VRGETQYQVKYTLAAVYAGKVNLPIVAPAPVNQMMAFVSEDGSPAITASGVEDAGSRKTEKGGTVHMFKAVEIAAGAQASLTIGNLPAEADTAAASGKGGAGESLTMKAPQVIAAAGTLLLVLFGLAFMLVRPAKAAHKRSAAVVGAK